MDKKKFARALSIVLLLFLILQAIFITKVSAQVQPLTDEADNVSGNARIEGEFKLEVPMGLENELYNYLLERYVTGDIGWLSQDLKVSTLNETFLDTYYDTSDFSLAKEWAGLRFRRRYDNGTLVKQLVQIKVTPNPFSNETKRYELKWPVRSTSVKKKELDNLDSHIFYRLINREDRESVTDNLNELGVNNLLDISEVVNIEQYRRRIYLSDSSDNLFITITLDETSSKRFWTKVSFAELELEMNEILYTSGDEQKRIAMEEINEKVFEDLKQRFPEIKQDQTPKYTKTFNFLSEKNKLFKVLLWMDRNNFI